MQWLSDHATINIELIIGGSVLPPKDPAADEQTLTCGRKNQQSSWRLVVSTDGIPFYR